LIKVLVAETLSQKAVELLKEIPEFEIVVKNGMSPTQLKKEIEHCEAIVVKNSTIIDKPTLEKAKNLKLIVKAGIGLDNIDVEAASSQNIEVKDTPLAAAIAVAEYTLAQMLGVCRYIGPAYQGMKEHKWEKNQFSLGMELHGKTAGIIGMGRIGKEVAKRELAMGMNVLYHDIADIPTGLNAKPVTLDQLLQDSDFISIHLPLTDSTHNFLSTEAFEKMKDNAVLVNASNGGIVDETALLNALETGKIKAAAVDVYEREPLENFTLVDHDRVFPAPHLGDSTIEAQARAGLETIAILKEFFNA
jgi:D-3-phosphoglycerate dehydrogenase